ncbi:zinc ribbon domain-containing protein [Levilactobacillus yonginensis]|uniref:zinc ribbon domain-containing protein n=1 Tax=Levilactobacillus yonginensis TaxID=1054041 RepID=UPI000F7B4C7C|nr:zinc-ribbon domain-containing protein [Levilactobacillus yonginensis]
MHLTPFMAPADNQPGGQSHFCPNCGQPVAPTDTFCQNCGYNLNTGQASVDQPTTPVQSTQTTAPAKPARVRKPHKPWDKKKKLKWGGIAVAIVAVAGFFIWGGTHYSRSATLDRTISHIKSGKNMTPYFTTASSDLKLSNQALLPVNRYYSDHGQALSDLKSALNSNGRSDDGTMTFEKSGHHFLIFPRYKINVSPVYPTVKTNHSGNVIKLDGKKIATASVDGYTKKLDAMVPGEYHLEASGTVGGHKLANSSDYHITTSKTYNLELKTISLSFNTVPGSAIYLNGKKLGTADNNGSYSLKDEPWTSDMAVYAQYSSTAGKATTNTVKLSDSDDQGSVDLKYPDVISNSDADDFFSNLFVAVDGITDEGDISDATDGNDDDLADFFTNGSSNSDYSELVSMAKGYANDAAVDSTDMTTTIKDIKPGPNGTSLVTYNVKYGFWLEDADYTHVQVLQYTATVKDSNGSNLGYVISSIGPATKLSDYHDNDD